MSGRCAQGYAKAKRAVEKTMSWTIKRWSAFSSQANKGLRDPEKPGRKLAMGAAAEDVMVRSINMLRAQPLEYSCLARCPTSNVGAPSVSS